MPRFFVIAVGLILLGILIVGKSVYIMTLDKDFWAEVGSRYQKYDVAVPPTRGDILSDNGEVLAASIPEYKMFMDFRSGERDTARVAKDQGRRDWLLLLKMDSICNGLHEIFPDIDPVEMRRHLLEGRAKRSMHWPLYGKRISYIQYKRVKQVPYLSMSQNRGGFHVEKFETRRNPYGKLAARTIGDLYAGKDSARSGIELGMDSVLRGQPGTSHRQKVKSSYLTIIDRPAEDGCDVQTTLNITMQDICEKALGDQLRELQAQGSGDVEFGVCILMEVATGDVKAITSLSKMKDGSFQEIQNKAISNLMEPGSVFKPMSFLVAFNDGYIGMDDPVNVGSGVVEMHGRKMKDHNWRTGGYGTITVRQCIQKSSNVGVSHFIDRNYAKNPQKFVDGIYATGVADDLHIPIPGYAKPRIKSPKSSSWAKTDLPWMSIGYVTQIPPISTLAFYNGIANGGRMMQPRFVKAILQNGEVVKELPPVVLREHMASDEAVRNIQTCLREVVTLGVGKKAGSKLVHTAGKTGTAQVWSAAGRTAGYLVSFAGFFPYEAPKYSCIVCINKTGAASGNLHCGPVFRRVAETVMAQELHTDYKRAKDSLSVAHPFVNGGNVMAAERVLGYLGVKYADNFRGETGTFAWGVASSSSDGVFLSKTTMEEGLVPDVKGYGLRDAVYRLERLGLKVRCVGSGRVTGQSLQPGRKVQGGEQVFLTLGNGKTEHEMPDSIKKLLHNAVEAGKTPTDSAAHPSLPDTGGQGARPQQPASSPSSAPQQGNRKRPGAVAPSLGDALIDPRSFIGWGGRFMERAPSA